MPKVMKTVMVVAVVAVVATGAFFAVKKYNANSDSAKQKNAAELAKEASSVPNGHALATDKSVTAYPGAGAVYGSGQTLTFTYDGSKSSGDANAVLSYDVSYTDENETFTSLATGTLSGKGSGDFTMADKIADAKANGKPGYVEISVTSNGKKTKLGLYGVLIEVK